MEETTNAPFWTKRVLTIKEVASYTGYSLSYLKKLTHLGEIPFSKPNGKSLFFDREKIEEWLLRNPQKTKDEIKQAAVLHVTSGRLPRRKT